MSNINSFAVGSTNVPSQFVEPSPSLSHWSRAAMVGVPYIGNARSFFGICVQDRMIIPKIYAQASTSVSYAPCLSLLSLEWSEVGLKKSQSVVSFNFISVISTSTSRMLTLHPHIPSPLHQTFHPWYSKKAPENVLQNAQSFLLTTIEESHLSGAGLVADNLHFVALPHSHSHSK